MSYFSGNLFCKNSSNNLSKLLLEWKRCCCGIQKKEEIYCFEEKHDMAPVATTKERLLCHYSWLSITICNISPLALATLWVSNDCFAKGLLQPKGIIISLLIGFPTPCGISSDCMQICFVILTIGCLGANRIGRKSTKFGNFFTCRNHERTLHKDNFQRYLLQNNSHLLLQSTSSSSLTPLNCNREQGSTDIPTMTKLNTRELCRKEMPRQNTTEYSLINGYVHPAVWKVYLNLTSFQEKHERSLFFYELLTTYHYQISHSTLANRHSLCGKTKRHQQPSKC